MGAQCADARKCILVVDDSAVDRITLRAMLADRYDTLEAAHGPDALAILERQGRRIAAVLLNASRLSLSEYDFLRSLRSRQEFASLPVMILAQLDDFDGELRALKLGATDICRRPCPLPLLQQQLENLLLFSEAVALDSSLGRDSLTGLDGREAFYARAGAVIAAGGEYMIASLDVERFKLINDLFGAAQGDALLRHVAACLKDALPKEALCGRLEADHFAICLPRTGAAEEALIALARDCLRDYPLDMKIELRLGLYDIVDTAVPVNIMCDRARMAGASIKGRFDQICARYNDEHRRALLKEQAIVNSMRDALEQEDFLVYFHPKHDLETMRLVGAEALVRWRHPRLGFISPASFVPIFEKSGFISAMDEYVWEHVCRHLRNWMDAGVPTVPVSVNLSRVDIHKPQLCELLLGLLRKYRLPIHMLRLEVTESSYMDDPQQLNATIRNLRLAGFFVEMDDFGSGYSSLNMLKDIYVDALKVDMRFLENSSDSRRGTTILTAVLRMARWLRLPVVAEGVETVHQVNFLRSVGCAVGQGNYFGRPIPADEFRTLLCRGPVGTESFRVPDEYADMEPEALWQASGEFSCLFNALPGVGACMCLLDGGELEVLRANDACRALLADGSGIGEIVLLEHICQTDRPAFLRALHAAAERRQPRHVCCRCRTASGRLVWLDAGASFLARSGERVLLALMLRDMTREKQREMRLCRQEHALARTGGHGAGRLRRGIFRSPARGTEWP